MGQPGTALILVLALGLGARLAFGPWPIDDAYITFRYARNLASGLGFVYNPGAAVLGTTTPGYTLLLVPPAWLGLDLARVSWVLAAGCDLLTVWLLNLLGRRSGRPWTGALAALLLLLAPKFVAWSSVSGMETSLYVLALVATVWLYERGWQWATTVVAGLALWVRPDALLLLAAVGLYARLSGKGWLLRPAALAGAVALPWVLFSWWYFGSPVPASVLAKASSNDLTAAQSVLALGGHFLGTWYERLLLLPFLAGLVLTLRQGGPGRLLLLWGLLYGVVFGAAGAFGHHLWYFVPLYVPYFWCASAGLLALPPLLATLTRTQGGWLPVQPATPARGWLAGGVLAGLLLWQLRLAHGHVAAEHAVREHLYREVATSLTSVSRGEGLAATEVGVLGWYFQGPVLDLVGLVSPEAIGRPYAETVESAETAESAEPGETARGPRWLVTYDDRFDDPAVLQSPAFLQEWQIEAAYPVSPTRTLYVFARTDLLQ